MARRAGSGAELRALLARRRITHMVVNEPGCDEYVKYGLFEWGERAQKNFISMWHTYGRKLFVANGVYLFELGVEPLPPRLRKTGTPSYFHRPETAERARGLTRRIETLFQANRHEEAFPLCEEVVRLTPGSAHPYCYRAYAHEKLGRYEEAIADYRSAILRGYPAAMVYFNLGVLLESKKKYAMALERYLEAIEENPKTTGLAWKRAADLAAYLGHHDLALELAKDMEANSGDQSLRDQVAKIARLAAEASEK